jgi:translation initiation factor IF-1
VELRYGGSDRDRRDVAGRIERLDGRVTSVDQRRGYFAMSDGRQNVLVHVSGRLSNNDARRFDRLRRGDRVRVEVRYAGRGQAELVRFR